MAASFMTLPPLSLSIYRQAGMVGESNPLWNKSHS